MTITVRIPPATVRVVAVQAEPPIRVSIPGSTGVAGGGAVAWAAITGKPTEFPPEAHTHPTSEVTGLDTALGLKAPLADPTFTGTPAAPTAVAATNTTQIATTAFVQTAVNAIIAAADAMVFKGVIDCSTNPNYPAADRGWTYRVSVAGKIGGASGVNVEAGDTLLCLTDGTASGDQATVGAQWNIAQTNIDGAVTGPASATDNALARFDAASGKVLQNSAVTLDDNGVLQVPSATTPAAPAAGNLKLFTRDFGHRMLPAFIGPAGVDSSLQPFLASNSIAYAAARGGSVVIDPFGILITVTGAATIANSASTNFHTRVRRVDLLVTTPATNAVAGMRGTAQQWTIGGDVAGAGGFHYVCRWGPATGMSNAARRAFMGLRAIAVAPTDVAPSSLTDLIGMGWEAADTNVQMMHNDGSGTATKIDLGASFPKPSADRTDFYELSMFSPPGTTQIVYWRVINLTTGAVATGSINSDIPTTTTFLNVLGYASAGGTSAVVGFAFRSVYVETDN